MLRTNCTMSKTFSLYDSLSFMPIYRAISDSLYTLLDRFNSCQKRRKMPRDRRVSSYFYCPKLNTPSMYFSNTNNNDTIAISRELFNFRLTKLEKIFFEVDTYGVLDCHNFLYPHEYTEETIGLFACLLRRSVGDINFSILLDKAKESQDPRE